MRTLGCLVVLLGFVVGMAGPASADSLEGQRAYDRGEFEQALEAWKPLAERGERAAQFRMGTLYEKGQGVSKDLEDAHKWYVLAWKRGHAEARTRALALRKEMSASQLESSKRKIRAWIRTFAPLLAHGVKGPPRGGISISMRETGRMKVEGATYVSYEVKTSGLDRRKRYRVWLWDLGMHLKDDPVVELDHPASPTKDRGVERSGEMEGGITWMLGSFVRGEWQRLSLTSSDGTQYAQVIVIPFPIQARKGGARIWLQLMDAKGKRFLAHGEGFRPNEKVTIVSRSNGEGWEKKVQADARGRLVPTLVFWGSVPGRTYKASWSVKRASGTLRVNYRWGPRSQKTL